MTNRILILLITFASSTTFAETIQGTMEFPTGASKIKVDLTLSAQSSSTKYQAIGSLETGVFGSNDFSGVQILKVSSEQTNVVYNGNRLIAKRKEISNSMFVMNGSKSSNPVSGKIEKSSNVFMVAFVYHKNQVVHGRVNCEELTNFQSVKCAFNVEVYKADLEPLNERDSISILSELYARASESHLFN